MTRGEFKKMVFEEAKKYLKEEIQLIPSQEDKELETLSESTVVAESKEDVSPEQIQKLVSEIKKINKSLDFRNPLISESEESLVESVIKEEVTKNIETAKTEESTEDKDVVFEGYKNKWSNILGYEIPKDETRENY